MSLPFAAVPTRTLAAAGLLAMALSAASAFAVRGPQADAVVTPPPTERIPSAEVWELRFEPGPLRVHVDPSDGRMYWYFTYTVGNRTGRERSWAPQFWLHGEAGDLQLSGRDVPSRVVREILEKIQAPGQPEILDQNQMIGPLATGREHDRDSVVVWPVIENAAPAGEAGGRGVSEQETVLAVYVTGLTSRRELLRGVAVETVELRQTRRLRYRVPGNVASFRDRPVEQVSQDWIYR
jgi:hypothetical protein